MTYISISCQPVVLITVSGHNGHKSKRPQTKTATNRNGNKPDRPQDKTVANTNEHNHLIQWVKKVCVS